MRGDIGLSLLILDHKRKGWAILSIDRSLVSSQEGQNVRSIPRALPNKQLSSTPHFCHNIYYTLMSSLASKAEPLFNNHS